MLVRLQHGSRVGEVLDFPPHEARAMLADGRATDPYAAPVPDPMHVAKREDRGMPRGQRKATR